MSADRSEYMRRYVAANKERLAMQASEYRRRNKEKIKERDRLFRINSPEKVKAARDKWRLANPHHKKAWDRNNPDKHRANVARRKSLKLRATPRWANEFFIREIYHLAMLRTKILGFKWDVDHIVPLRSKLVCGLHVENNLQVITANDNAKKGNRFWPDMP